SGNIMITGTVNADAAANNRTFSLIAGTGSVQVTGAIGGSQPVQTFTITSAGSASLQNVPTRSPRITITPPTPTLNPTLSPNSSATAGNASITGAVVLATNEPIATHPATSGNITITGTVNADAATNSRTLTLIAGTANVQITGAVGGSQAVQTFTVTSAN